MNNTITNVSSRIINEKTLKIETYKFIPFPNKNNYAESMDIDYQKGYIYLALNNTETQNPISKLNNFIKNTDDTNTTIMGLYRYRITAIDTAISPFELVFPFNETILGCKFRNGKFYGANVEINSLFIYDTDTQTSRSIPLLVGCPNDLCVSRDDKYVFIGVNMDYHGHNGVVLRVDLQTQAVIVLLGNHINAKLRTNLYSITGINRIENTLYISTLLNVVSYHVPTNSVDIIISDLKSTKYPLYDNITVYYPSTNGIGSSRNLLSPSSNPIITVAIYDYGQKTMYREMHNEPTLFCGVCSLSLLCGSSAYFDRVNYANIQSMSKSKISFIQWSQDSETLPTTNTEWLSLTYDYITFSDILPEFDKEVTQINKYSNNLYFCINYKANGIMLVKGSIV